MIITRSHRCTSSPTPSMAIFYSIGRPSTNASSDHYFCPQNKKITVQDDQTIYFLYKNGKTNYPFFFTGNSDRSQPSYSCDLSDDHLLRPPLFSDPTVTFFHKFNCNFKFSFTFKLPVFLFRPCIVSMIQYFVKIIFHGKFLDVCIFCFLFHRKWIPAILLCYTTLSST